MDAAKLACKLLKLPTPDRIYSSDLLRVKQTLTIVQNLDSTQCGTQIDIQEISKLLKDDKTNRLSDIDSHDQNVEMKKDVIFTKLLREKHGGIYCGQPLKVLLELAEKERKPSRAFRPIDGESWEDLATRVNTF
mmetsp:Transcript_74220/g.160459  ORF Transcript_74220/g.160459 Transcript_74220/m.160459 type:complete len:134 (-) Transcript_74220:326-727(-)